MQIALWVAQSLLAFAFLMAGSLKVFAFEKYRAMSRRAPEDPGLPKPLATFIGVSEIAGAFGVVLPAAAGILPILTPIAAASLALVMVLALGHHTQHRDPIAKMVPPLVLLALAVFVAWGRGVPFVS